MKKFALSIAAFAAVGIALGTAGTANADEGGYFTALTDYGYGDTSQDVALNVGYGVCKDRAAGVARQATIDDIYNTTNDAVDAKDAAFLYDAAVAHLC